MWKRQTTENTRLQSFGQCAEVVERRGHFEKVCLKAKCSTHSLEVPQASTSSTGAGEPLYFDDQVQPVFNTHMVSVLHSNKHLIKFPIALDNMTLRGRNKIENSINSTGHTKCSTVLLKADTGADVNLMNNVTFDSLFDRSVLQLTPIRMENYGNTSIKVPCISQMEGQGVQTTVLCYRL